MVLFIGIFIALVVPNLPDPNIREWQMGLIAAKIIVFFFSYEIINFIMEKFIKT